MSERKAKAPKSTSARKKAEVARAEKKADEPKTVNFRGLKIHLPAEPPGTLLFDIADMEGGREFAGMMELIKSLVGIGQYQALRAKIREENLSIPETSDALAEFVSDIIETSGLTEGE